MAVAVRCSWLLLLWVVTTAARGDELVMKNGDRLTGTIVVKQGNTLRFKVSYAGELQIAWSQIARINTSQPLHLELVAKAQPSALSADEPQLIRPDAPPLALTQIDTITQQQGLLTGWHHHSALDLKGDLRRDKSHSDDVNVKFRNEWRHADVRLNLDLEWDHLKSNGKVTENELEVDPRLDYLLSPSWFWRGEVDLNRSFVDQSDEIAAYITGPGYQFSDDALLTLELVALYAHLDFKLASGAEFNLLGPGMQWRYRQRLWGTSVELYSDALWLHPNDYLIEDLAEQDSGLRYYLNEHLFMSLSSKSDLIRVNGETIDNWRHRFGVGAKW